MAIEILGRQNPWWTDAKTIDADPLLMEFDNSPIKWLPQCLKHFRLNQNAVYVISGPRQVGKTTTFKFLIRQLIKEFRVPPRYILYLNTEEIAPSTPQNLAEIIRNYIMWVRIKQSERLYVFIDEATYLTDWERGIKILADYGLLKNITVFATGSHAIGLRRGSERLPGRRGRAENLDIQLLPLSFREYLMVMEPNLKDKIPEVKSFDFKVIMDSVQEVSLFADLIIRSFHSYLKTGGFLRAMRDFLSFGLVKPDIYRLYRDALVGDLVRMGRREKIFKELCQWLIGRRENPFEWVDIARETYVGTHPTVREYIEDAEATFLWEVFYGLKQIGKPLALPRAPKRLYFKDPFLFHTIRAWVLSYPNPYQASSDFLSEPPNLGYLVENVVASHIKRNWENVFYWRNGGEIDFVIFENNKKRLLLEVKYRVKIDMEDGNVIKKWGKGILLTQRHLEKQNNLLLIPTPYFLALLPCNS